MSRLISILLRIADATLKSRFEISVSSFLGVPLHVQKPCEILYGPPGSSRTATAVRSVATVARLYETRAWYAHMVSIKRNDSTDELPHISDAWYKMRATADEAHKAYPIAYPFVNLTSNMRFFAGLLTLAALASSVVAHGIVTAPPTRTVGLAPHADRLLTIS